MLLGKQGFEHKKASISGVAVRGWMVYQRQSVEIKIAKTIRTSGQHDNQF